MKAHTSDFKEQIKQFGRELDSKITYEIGNEEIELGKEELNSISPHYEGAILKSVMKQLDIDSNVEMPIGTILRYQFGVKVDEEYEYIDYGNYVVYSIEKQEDTNSYKIVCYDKMLYAMKEYENSDITFPIAIKEYLEAICDKIGLEYEESPFANDDKIIANELFLDSEGKSMNYTFRDVLDQIAEASGGTICINKDDKLEIRYIHDVGEITDVSNSNIEITDGEEAELQAFELEGKTEQEATPTPDNPSELNSVGYENLTYLGSKVGGVQYLNDATSYNDYIFEPGTYTLNYNDSNTITTYIRGETDTSNISLGTSKTITFTKNEKFNLWFYRSGLTENEISNLQLVKGTKTYTYIPYGKYGIEVKMIGKNIFDLSSLTSKTQNGITFTKNDDGTIIINGTATATAYYNFPFLYLKSGDYYLSGNARTNYQNGITMVANYGRYYTDAGNGVAMNITNVNTPTEFYIRVNPGYEINNAIVKPMITCGENVDVDYEPYKGNTQLYTLDEPLRSIGNTKDLLYIRNGTLYVDRKIGKLILKGTENWQVSNTGTPNYIYYAYISNFKPKTTGGYSNYYKFISIGGSDTNQGIFAVPDYVRIRYGAEQSIASFKSWLTANNVELDYLLTTPYTEEIGQVQMPSVYDGITYIQTTDALKPIMNVSYISEFEEIDEEYLKDVNVNFGEKYGAINTIVLSRGGDGDKISASIPADLPDEDKVAIQITDNQIMNGNDRNEYMAGILNRLYGLEYYINDFTSTGICYLDLCDRYRIKIGDTSYKCVMFNDEANITQGLSESIYTDLPKEEQQEYKYMSSTDRGITQANIIAKKNEAEIVEYTQKLDDTNNRINAVETKQTETDRTINIISTNIDANGNITEVTTTTGFTFNAKGMTIEDSGSNFKALHRNDGTYYKDGENIVGQYTKDGSKQKDLALFGVYYYGMDDIEDTPMFVAQLYHDENGEEAFGHFYNRGD